MTKLMTKSVGTAISSRRTMYRLISSRYRLVPADCRRGREPPPASLLFIAGIRRHRPVLNVPELVFPAIAGCSLQLLRLGDGLEPPDQRDHHGVGYEVVIGLNRELVPLGLVGLLAQVVNDRVVGRVGVPLYVGSVPAVVLLRDVLRRPVA